MERGEARIRQPAPAGIRFVRRTLRADFGELALTTLEQTGQDLLALGASREPDAQTVLDLLALAEIVEQGSGEEAAHVFDAAVRVGVRSARRLQEAERWRVLPRGGDTGLRHASLAYLDSRGRGVIERIRRVVEEGMGAPGLAASFRGWSEHLADVAAELEDVAAGFGAWGETAGEQIAAEAAAALRAGGGAPAEDLAAFRALLRACPSPPEERGTGASC